MAGTVIDDLPKDIWLLRPCEVYKEEYRDCKRILSRMYQYYVDGESKDCKVWLSDYKNCMAYRKSRDSEALNAVLTNEKERRAQRLAHARGNNVWEYRKSPPAEWFSPISSQNR